MIHSNPTDPLEVLEDMSISVIRREVDRLRAQVAVWEPRPIPAYFHEPDYCRPIRRGWGF